MSGWIEDERSRAKAWNKVHIKALEITKRHCEDGQINGGLIPEELAEYIKVLCNPEITTVIVQGGPGTGKAYTAALISMLALSEGAARSIKYTKPLVSAGGKSLGSEPGGVKEKMHYWLRPALQAVERVMMYSKLQQEEMMGAIESFPIDRMRGISLAAGEWLVSDESQNCHLPLYKCLLTRAESQAKAVLIGDVGQLDMTISEGWACGMQQVKSAWEELVRRSKAGGENETASMDGVGRTFRIIDLGNGYSVRNPAGTELAQWLETGIHHIAREQAGNPKTDYYEYEEENAMESDCDAIQGCDEMEKLGGCHASDYQDTQEMSRRQMRRWREAKSTQTRLKMTRQAVQQQTTKSNKENDDAISQQRPSQHHYVKSRLIGGRRMAPASHWVRRKATSYWLPMVLNVISSLALLSLPWFQPEQLHLNMIDEGLDTQFQEPGTWMQLYCMMGIISLISTLSRLHHMAGGGNSDWVSMVIPLVNVMCWYIQGEGVPWDATLGSLMGKDNMVHSMATEVILNLDDTIMMASILTAFTGWIITSLRKWYSYWDWILACETRGASFKAMTVQFLCPDGVTRDFLFDSGAAASLLPNKLFRRCCEITGMRPSKLRLRAANGQIMQGMGTSSISLRTPNGDMDEDPIITHRCEVMPDGSMPAELIILGVDFWDKLNPRINWRERSIICTGTNGKEFILPFTIGSKDSMHPENIRGVNMIGEETQTDTETTATLRLPWDIHLLPGEQRLLPLRLEEDDPHLLLKGIFSLHTLLPSGYMWDNAVVDIDSEDGAVWYVIQNPSRTDNASFAAGMGVARLTHHNCMGDYIDTHGWEASDLDDDYITGRASHVTTTDVNLIVTAPLDKTKNRQHVSELEPGHKLRGTAFELNKATVEDCLTEEGSKAFKNWKDTIANTFGWGEGISNEMKTRFINVLYQFKDVFSVNPKAPPAIKGVECALYFREQNPTPFYRPPPRLSPEEAKYMDSETDMMLRNGIITFSDSEWATVPVFAKKKPNADGTSQGLRYAIDFRGLNAQLCADRMAMPHMEDVLDSLSEATIFSTFDISSGFWG